MLRKQRTGDDRGTRHAVRVDQHAMATKVHFRYDASWKIERDDGVDKP